MDVEEEVDGDGVEEFFNGVVGEVEDEAMDDPRNDLCFALDLHRAVDGLGGDVGAKGFEGLAFLFLSGICIG